MSRVEEALKRAAGGTGDGVSTQPRALDRVPPPHAPGVPATVEDYPGEADEGQPRRVVGRLQPRPVAARSLAEAPIAATRDNGRPLTGFGSSVEGKLIVDAETSAVSIEQYRRLAAMLHQMQVTSDLHSLMISSALPRDGKTLTATNLALTLSEAFRRRVLLVDADLRRPSIHEVLRLPNTRGLADGLRHDFAGTLPLIEVSPTLAVLPAGAPDHSPMAGLTSDRMRAVLQEARARFDWIILDTPPIGLISDANLLAALVDGVLLVIAAGKTDYPAVKRVLTELDRSRIVGVVLNRVNADQAPAVDYYAELKADRGSSS